MLDPSGSLSECSLRPMSQVKIADTNEIQTKFYKFGELLGRGTFGTVMKATEIKTGSEWAIKVINKAQSGASRLKLFQREINILRVVHHPNIIHLERVLEAPNTLFLVFELCNGELRQIFQNKKVFSEEETRTVVASLASAVSYLHRNDIVHRDLKLENILVTTNPNDPDDKLFIKVTDFGLSVVRGGVGHESMLQELCGTPAYMSPELFGQRMYTQQCDVWAMGVIMYLLLTGSYPFEAGAGRTLAMVVVSQEPNYDVDPFKGKDETASSKLLRKMLEKNPAYRATASEVENDPWTRGSQGEEPAAKNAMELMRLWKQDMRQPSFQDYDQRKSVRRLSLLLDTMRTAARSSDDQARKKAIRKTFGDETASPPTSLKGPQAPITSRNRQMSNADRQISEGDSSLSSVEENDRVSRRRRTASIGAAAVSAAAAGTNRCRSLTVRKKHLSIIQEVKGRTSPRPPVKTSLEPLEMPPSTTTNNRKSVAYGVVVRERKKTYDENASSVNLMPADKAPPIVYYEKHTVQSKYHRKKTAEARSPHKTKKNN